ncbi:MAG: large repetitive protein, partial [Acidimicrobiaceae bacterium]
MNSSLHVEAGTTAVTPGTAVPVPVRVCNTGDTAMQVLVRIVGVEDSWAGPPLMVGPLEAGEETTVEFPIRIPVGFPPCDHLAGIEAEPIDPTTGAPLGRAVFVEVVLEIGDGSQVRASLEPADIHGGGRGKFRLSLRNRGRHPVNVTLAGESPGDALSVRFSENEVVLPPGEFVRVKGKVKGSRHLLGPHRRLPFVVTIRSRGTPRHLDGSFTQSPALKSGLMKGLALVAVVGMWASILVIGLGRISPPKKGTSTQAAATQSTTASDAGGGDAAAGGGAAGGDANSGGGGSGGDSTAAAAPKGSNEIKVGGKVTGSDPSGATVSIEATSLVDENAQGASFVNDSPSNALTMHYGHTGVSAPSLVGAARTTTTDADGAWAFGGIKSPGYYLIIISKAGFATKKFVVTAPEDGSPIVLDSELIAGDGTLGGAINGPDGALGGVDLTITDGTVTLKTLTPTTGDIGKWSVTGLTTPGTYLVMAS